MHQPKTLSFSCRFFIEFHQILTVTATSSSTRMSAEYTQANSALLRAILLTKNRASRQKLDLSSEGEHCTVRNLLSKRDRAERHRRQVAVAEVDGSRLVRFAVTAVKGCVPASESMWCRSFRSTRSNSEKCLAFVLAH